MVVLDCHLLREAVEKGAKLIDVREPHEYGRGKLHGAVNVPLSKFGNMIREHAAEEDEVLLYCHSGGRSGAAAEALQNAGYSNVKNIGGVIHYVNCIS